jgi:ribosomal protein S10
MLKITGSTKIVTASSTVPVSNKFVPSVYRVVQLMLTSYDKSVAKDGALLHRAAELVGVASAGPVTLPTKFKRWTVLRSPFKHKTAQESFEQRIHRRFVTIEGEKQDVNRFIRFARAFAGQGVGVHYRIQNVEPLENYYR